MMTGGNPAAVNGKGTGRPEASGPLLPSRSLFPRMGPQNRAFVTTLDGLQAPGPGMVAHVSGAGALQGRGAGSVDRTLAVTRAMVEAAE